MKGKGVILRTWSENNGIAQTTSYEVVYMLGKEMKMYADLTFGQVLIIDLLTTRSSLLELVSFFWFSLKNKETMTCIHPLLPLLSAHRYLSALEMRNEMRYSQLTLINDFMEAWRLLSLFLTIDKILSSPNSILPNVFLSAIFASHVKCSSRVRFFCCSPDLFAVQPLATFCLYEATKKECFYNLKCFLVTEASFLK